MIWLYEIQYMQICNAHNHWIKKAHTHIIFLRMLPIFYYLSIIHFKLIPKPTIIKLHPTCLDKDILRYKVTKVRTYFPWQRL